jgi:TonB family protein
VLLYNWQLDMIRKIAVTFCLLLASICVYAEQASSASEKALAEAGRIVDLRAAGEMPFRLDTEFLAQLNVPWEGHLTLEWAAPNLWSRKISMGAYQQVDVRKGEILYTKRNAPFTPLVLKQLFDLLNVFDAAPEEWRIKQIRQERNASGIDCVSIRQKSTVSGPWKTAREVCIDHVLNTVLSDQEKNDVELQRKEFSDYREFRSHRNPYQMKLMVNGSVLLKVQVASLTDASIAPAALLPPSGAIERRQCENMTYPKPVHTPDPAYPRDAARNGFVGTVEMAVTVLADGSIGDANVIQSAGQEMDKAAIEKVKTWKFKPAMCGNEPVSYDLNVSMNFRLD